jgi:hypothetical protein
MENKVAQSPDFHIALKEFESAWNNPSHTRFELPPVHVNQVLRQRYQVDKSVALTRDQLWDMELKKAWDPKTYIPYVVSEGRSWDREKCDGRTEHFFRSSIQRGWVAPKSGRVLEEVFIDHDSQRVLFLGRERFVDKTQDIRTDPFQPLFHVEHGASGYSENPINLWRIVVLTEGRDERFTEPFKEMVRAGWLPGFVEIYVEQLFDRKLVRRESQA